MVDDHTYADPAEELVAVREQLATLLGYVKPDGSFDMEGVPTHEMLDELETDLKRKHGDIPRYAVMQEGDGSGIRFYICEASTERVYLIRAESDDRLWALATRDLLIEARP